MVSRVRSDPKSAVSLVRVIDELLPEVFRRDATQYAEEPYRVGIAAALLR